MLRSVRGMTGYSLRAIDGQIGRVRDAYFDDQRWGLRYFVIDTGHRLAGRHVLISPLSLLGIMPERRRLQTSLTKAQVASSPDFDSEKPVSRQHEIELHQYYGLPYSWTGDAIEPIAPPAALAVSELDAGRGRHGEHSDPHLRSAKAVTHYGVHGRDGSIGHVADLLCNDASWSIGHIVVSVGHSWSGRKVLVPVGWVEWVSWIAMSVYVGLRNETVRLAPQYDSSAPPSAEYLARLAAYYDAPLSSVDSS